MNKFPVLKVNTGSIRENARVMNAFCNARGLDVAGVIKFSDGNIDIAKAYLDGGCKQLASSRTVHLKYIKQEIADAVTMLIRIPMISECAEVVKWCDISLNSQEKTLKELNRCAAEQDKIHSVLLMLDVGDRREGVVGKDRLLELALMVENELDNLHLAGIGASFACVSGVLPHQENLGELAEAAIAIESAIGRELEIISGGSSITLTMLVSGVPLPEKINHLRIGGSIANPMAIRQNRGVAIEGMREDTFTLTAEVVEVETKPSAAQGSGKNWAGKIIERQDRGTRTRAIIALGSQDIGDSSQLVPVDQSIEVAGGSSDHTVLDITGHDKNWEPGDTMDFSLYYMGLLYCFSTRNVRIEYV
jgi:predicted amino acid racemase